MLALLLFSTRPFSAHKNCFCFFCDRRRIQSYVESSVVFGKTESRTHSRVFFFVRLKSYPFALPPFFFAGTSSKIVGIMQRIQDDVFVPVPRRDPDRRNRHASR